MVQKKVNNNTYLILGATDAGKTALFTRVSYTAFLPAIVNTLTFTYNRHVSRFSFDITRSRQPSRL
jgi:hypothetical protein